MVNVSIFPVFCVLPDLFPGCQKVIVAKTTYTGQSYLDLVYLAYNVLGESQDFIAPGAGAANYWLSQDGKAGGQFFLLDLGCQQRIGGVKLINSRNFEWGLRATNEFK